MTNRQLSSFSAVALVGWCCSSGAGTGTDARPDLPPVCELGTSYTFTISHGLNPRTETGRLAPPASFSYEKRVPPFDAGTPSCAPALPACNTAAMVDVADLEADLAHPDVQRALTQAAPVIYGPKGVSDANNLAFTRADGRGFSQYDSECGAESATCRATPAGVHQLLADLQALVTQALADPSCAALR